MRQEIHNHQIWTKNISWSRNQLQAQVLSLGVGTLLAVLSTYTLLPCSRTAILTDTLAFESIALSVAFATTVWMLKAATPAAATCGGMVCLLVTYWTVSSPDSIVHSALPSLVALFLITFLATQAGRQRKLAAGLAELRTGRTASQVIANLSVSALCVTPFVRHFIASWSSQPIRLNSLLTLPIMKVMCLAALAEATADTVSSEIGQAFGGTPFMLTTLRRVPSGIDGAITPLGTLSGIGATALVAVTGIWSMHLRTMDTLIVIAAGIGGLFFDSFLGATAERRGWLGNDLVNLTSTAFVATLAAILGLYFP